MSFTVAIAGTGTGIGKTVFAAALTAALDGNYWKPVQAGLSDGETDSETVKRLSALPQSRILPEVYVLKTPASPHFAAERDETVIDSSRLIPPAVDRPLVIELAGGLLVPLNRQLLQIEMVRRWRCPVILCASTQLGTINHSLLSIEALKARSIPILGIAFIGEENADSQRTIADFGRVKTLGRLPWLAPLDSAALGQAFATNFDIANILGITADGP